MALALTKENFNEIINGDKPVLVDFWQLGVVHAKCWHQLSKNWQQNWKAK